MAVKLVDVEVTDSLPDIACTDHYSEVWVLVKMDGVPIGQVGLDACPEGIPADRLAREICRQCGEVLLRHRLYRHFIGRPEPWQKGVEDVLRDSPTDDPSPEATRLPSISVLVCTRDRPESLRDTLDSLARLEYPSHEVLVIDNCPSDGRTSELVAQHPFRYILEPRPGLDWARNRGIAESGGEVVAFIDDDATADPGWLRGIADGFAEEDTACVTGLVLPAEMETAAQQLFEKGYGGFGRGFNRQTFKADKLWKYACYWPSLFGTGCNMAFRREAFDSVGLFDVALDVGTPTGGGGDMDMFHRLVYAGCTIAYRPEAVVRHRHRRSDHELRELLFNYGKSFTAFLSKCLRNEPEARIRLLRFSAKWCLNWFVKRTLRSLFGRNGLPVGLIGAEALGTLCGPRAYTAALRRAKSIESEFMTGEVCASGN